MKKSILVFGILILFIGISVIPATGNIGKAFFICKSNNPPYEPSNPIPPNGSTNISEGICWTGGDPDDDGLCVFICWGDGNNTGWLGPYDSSYEFTESHKWEEQGTYQIRARAKDEHGAESDWGTLEVTMPKNKPFIFNFNLLSWLFERFPNMFPILRYLLGL
ncbi:MAG: hypothetical protein JSW60_04415 [Thermoplasmatales archaeon]|nr:MAG: hypothetical protein JSW60_04415 [Thermoplasmatales archaeon]